MAPLLLGLLLQDISFPTERTVVRLDASRVVAFRAEPGEERAPQAVVSDPAVVEILRGPQILAGESIGYLRVRGLKEGKAVLTVGGARITLEVRPPSPQAAAIRIVAPVDGAAVWGRIHVGVEAAGAGDVRLRLPEGELAPVAEQKGEMRRLTFEVDADRLAPGDVELRAIRGDAESEPVVVRVVRPESPTAGECETLHAGDEPARLGSDEAASGGAYVANHAEAPLWSTSVEAAEAGWHQVIVVARGDLGGGAFPSVGVYVGESDAPLTAGRLFDRVWRRTPVGYPVYLPKGPTRIALRFMNDYWVSARSDRNLYLDRFELARLESGSAAHLGAEGMMRMMSSAEAPPPSSERRLAACPERVRPGRGLSVAFAQPWEGLAVNGTLIVRGFCWWDDIGQASAPTVHLLVNGKPVGEQCAVDVWFFVDRGLLREGDNTLRLVAAHPDGRTAASPEQTVRARGEAGATRAFHRFTAMDPRWDEEILERLPDRKDDPGNPELLWPRFAGGGRASLDLPESLAGEFDLYVEGEGPDASVTIQGERRSVPVRGELVEPVAFTLKAGPKPLTIEFTEGLLRSVVLRGRRSGPDRSPPGARVLYPTSGAAVFGADVVVAEAWDGDDVAWVDLRVDGVSMQLHTRRHQGAGAVVFPLVLRDLEPGEHTLAVRAADGAENLGDSEEIRFTVLDREPGTPGPYARALRLLDRFAYGPDPDSLARILTAGEEAWLGSMLDSAGAGDAAALGLAEANLRGWDNAPWLVADSVIKHVSRTDNPVRTRLLTWVENHFSTWMGKVGYAGDEWGEHVEFARQGPAPFQELLTSSATSPAMLHYLDQGRSYAGNLNENYAREIMELHTLGVDGGYTQRDVTRLAHVLCGWNVSDEANRRGGGDYAREFRFVPEIADGRPWDILGMRFERAARPERFDRARLAIEMLAAHPSTATYVCRKLAQHYVAMPAPEGLVEDLATVFMESGGDLGAVLRAIARHPAFWDPDLPARLASPFDYGVRLLRVTRAHDGDWALQGFLDRSGMGLFDCVTPDGYPEEDGAWANANGMLQRWSFVQDIRWWFADLAPGGLLEAADEEAEQYVVDVLAQRIVGRPLGEASNAAALEVLRAAGGDPWERVMNTGIFVARLPEANLR